MQWAKRPTQKNAEKALAALEQGKEYVIQQTVGDGMPLYDAAAVRVYLETLERFTSDIGKACEVTSTAKGPLPDGFE